MRGRHVGLVVALATLAPASSASAAKVGIDFQSGDIGFAGHYIVEYVADPGEVNQPSVTATPGAGIVTIRDPSATISADPPTHTPFPGYTYADSPCTVLDGHTAECVLPDPRWVREKVQAGMDLVWATIGGFTVDLELGDRNDTYTPAPVGPTDTTFPLFVSGGDGNDTITTGPGPTTVDAGAGNDTIYAANHQYDTVWCGAGNDRVRTADAIDTLEADCEMVP